MLENNPWIVFWFLFNIIRLLGCLLAIFFIVGSISPNFKDKANTHSCHVFVNNVLEPYCLSLIVYAFVELLKT